MTQTAIEEAPTADPVRPRRGNRRQAIAVAALQILGEQGSRSLTHRAIDKLLGLPEGTTSAYFRRREDLVGAAVRELFRHDIEVFDQQMGSLLASNEPLSLDQVVAFFAGMVRGVRWSTSETHKLARYECFLLARRDKEADRLLRDLFDVRQGRDQQLFERLGAADPERAAIRLGYTLRGTFFTLAFLPEPASRLDVADEDFIRSAILAAMA